MAHTKGLGLVILALSAATPALAQDQTQDQTPPPAQSQTSSDTPSDDTTVVTVTGQRDGNRIDKQVYDVSSDPTNENASVEDVLKKVPGVGVDSNGDVTLRGKRTVIYINGRPSLLLAGDNRSLALKSMPSKIISKVEVISNPGAQYGSEGSGGVINLVTASNLPPSYFGNQSLKIDSAGGYQPGLFRALSTEKLTLMGYIGVNRNETSNQTTGRLTQFDANGAPASFNRPRMTMDGHALVPVLFASMEYRLGKDDVLSGQITAFDGTFDGRLKGVIVDMSPAGVQTSAIGLDSLIDSAFEGQSLNLSWMHYGQKPDETLKVSADLSNNVNASDSLSSLTFERSVVPGLEGTTQQTRQSGETTARKAILSVDYNTTIDYDQLSTGLQVTHDDNEQISFNFGPGAPGSDLVLNPNLGQFFRWRQTLYAAYVTYQKEIGDNWTVLGGLRSESLSLITHQLRGDEVNRISYTRITPSFYATYVASSRQKFRFNYSQRLERPAPYDIGSALVYENLNQVFRGNPRLEPQITNSFELSEEYSHEGTERATRLFFRQDTQLISTLSRIIPDPQNLGNVVVETTRLNQGRGHTAGVSFYYSRKLTASWKLDTDVTVSQSSITTPVWPQARSLVGIGGKVALAYSHPKTNDQLRIDLSVTPKTLTTQGYTNARSAVNLLYTHNINPKTQITFGANDIFRTDRKKTVIQTPLIYSKSAVMERAPLFYVTLTRNFFNLTGMGQ